MTFKVIATDGLDKEAIERLQTHPFIQLEVCNGVPAHELQQTVSDSDLVIIRSATNITAELLQNLPTLKAVLRAGVGTDNVNIPMATELGIYVWNAPTGNFQSTAEMALALLFSLARRIPEATDGGKKGQWLKKELSAKGRQLYGSTLGIFGAGNIGKRTAAMAHGLGMDVQICDPAYPENEAFRKVDFNTLLSTSNFISIHAPSLPSTKGIFNYEAFGKMKRNSFIINAARGGIINDQDLYRALKEGLIEGAGLDVFEEEPFDKNPLYAQLLALPQVVSTPHMGASTLEAQRMVGLESADKIIAIANALQGLASSTISLSTQPLPFPLNRPQNPRWTLPFS